MVWFKVDDKLHDHRKARSVRRSAPGKHRDVAPFGLWTLAGSWCGANKTGGFIPTEVLEEWDDDAEDLAERLVTSGLWWHDEVAGEPGYRFHDWADQNPADGEDPGDYGRRGNHIRWHEKRGHIDPDCVFCSPPDSSDHRPDIAPDHQGESGGESSRPDPTRPDPTRPRLLSASTDVEREFDEWYAAYPRKKAKGQAVKAYKGARKKTSAQVLLDAVEKQRDKLTASGPNYVPYPASWLNGERWLDEEPPHPSGPAGFPHGGTEAEKDAWVAAQPLPTDGAYYGGSRR